MKNRLCLVIILFLLLLTCGIRTAFAEDKAKVIGASRAESPPVIDGVPDDACWKAAEVRGDFEPADELNSTTMRFLYDEKNLYLAVECVWKDPAGLKQKVSEIRSAPGFREGFVNVMEFTDFCSIEVFLDPEATRVRHYQILFNAANQICGHFKGNWDNPFPVNPSGKARLNEKGWTAELVFPAEGLRAVELKPGQEWGLNLLRNDLTPRVATWKHPGAVFNSPKRFGRLLIGDYVAWWQATWNKAVPDRLKAVSQEIENARAKNPTLYAICQDVLNQKKEVEGARESTDPSTRAEFLKLYAIYADFNALLHRAERLRSTSAEVLAARP